MEQVILILNMLKPYQLRLIMQREWLLSTANGIQKFQTSYQVLMILKMISSTKRKMNKNFLISALNLFTLNAAGEWKRLIVRHSPLRGINHRLTRSVKRGSRLLASRPQALHPIPIYHSTIPTTDLNSVEFPESQNPHRAVHLPMPAQTADRQGSRPPRPRPS